MAYRALGGASSIDEYPISGSVPSAEWTCAAWIRALQPSGGSTAQYITSFHESGNLSSTEKALALSENMQPMMYIYTGAVGGITGESRPVMLGEWVHLACTQISGVLSLYMNGLLVKQASGYGNSYSSYITPRVRVGLGASPLQTYSKGFEGDIFDVAHWNVALNNGQIQALAQMGARPSDFPAGRVFYARYENGSPASFHDGSTGTRVGTPEINGDLPYPSDSWEAILGTLSSTPPSVPEITVTGNGVTIVDGDATSSLTDHTDFGSIVQGGSTVSRICSFDNTGDVTLTISSVVVPTGFTVTGALPGTITVGSNSNLTIRLDNAVVGAKSGDVEVTIAEIGVFNFAITGTVTAPVASSGGNSWEDLGPQSLIRSFIG